MSNDSAKKSINPKKNIKPKGTYTIKDRKFGATTKAVNFIYQEASAVVKPGIYTIRNTSLTI